MPTYVILGRYTDQGMRYINEAPGRLDKSRALLEEMGGSIKSFFFTLGHYEFIMVIEAPDDAVTARFAMKVGMVGNVRTEVMKAFPEGAFREIIQTIQR